MSHHDHSHRHRDRLVWGVILIAVGVIFLLPKRHGHRSLGLRLEVLAAHPHPVGRPEAHRRPAEAQGSERTGLPVRSQAGLTMRAREVFLALLIIFGGVFPLLRPNGAPEPGRGGLGRPLRQPRRGVRLRKQPGDPRPPCRPAWTSATAMGGGDRGFGDGPGDDPLPQARLAQGQGCRPGRGRRAEDDRQPGRRPASFCPPNRDDFKRKSFETDFKIVVPAGTRVLVKNSYGPIKVRETGASELINSHGRISASAVAGRAGPADIL